MKRLMALFASGLGCLLQGILMTIDETLEAGAPPVVAILRGIRPDESVAIAAALIEAGIDFSDEGDVPAELIAMEHVVLLPHLGSASVATRDKMDQLVVDNLASWAAGKPPLTPVPETPWPPKKRV